MGNSKSYEKKNICPVCNKEAPHSTFYGRYHPKCYHAQALHSNTHYGRES